MAVVNNMGNGDKLPGTAVLCTKTLLSYYKSRRNIDLKPPKNNTLKYTPKF